MIVPTTNRTWASSYSSPLVEHPHKAVEAKPLLVVVGDEQVIGAPGDALVK